MKIMFSIYKFIKGCFLDRCPCCGQYGWNLFINEDKKMDEDWNTTARCRKCGYWVKIDHSGW
jgi:hypothetical protein